MAQKPPAETEEERVEKEDAPVSASAEAAADDLTEAKRERDEYLELAQRTRADFDNYRKRVAKDAAAAAEGGKAELAAELIPVLDNLERALAAAEADGDAASGAEPRLDSLAKGVTLVLEELRSTLGRAGVEAYDPTGEQFDPSWHEALSTRADGAKAGTVIETLDKGYRLDGRVLRPARVVVSE